MVDSIDIYKSINVRIGTIIKITFLLRYNPDQHKTPQMCDKAILENGGTLKSVPDFYKNQEMCNKVVDNYPHRLELFSELKKCEIKLLMFILLQKNLFLNAS